MLKNIILLLLAALFVTGCGAVGHISSQGDDSLVFVRIRHLIVSIGPYDAL